MHSLNLKIKSSNMKFLWTAKTNYSVKRAQRGGLECWKLQPFLESSWAEEGRGGMEGQPSPAELRVSVSWLSRAWWQSRAAGQGVAAGLQPGQSEEPNSLDHAFDSVKMFDNSHYPFNCFNYDGDGYPSSSTDEEKKMCRPAYRYGWFVPLKRQILLTNFFDY